METKELNDLGERLAKVAQAAFEKAKIEWLIENQGKDRHRIIIAIAAKQQGGPDQEYPPGRE